MQKPNQELIGAGHPGGHGMEQYAPVAVPGARLRLGCAGSGFWGGFGELSRPVQLARVSRCRARLMGSTFDKSYHAFCPIRAWLAR